MAKTIIKFDELKIKDRFVMKCQFCLCSFQYGRDDIEMGSKVNFVSCASERCHAKHIHEEKYKI